MELLKPKKKETILANLANVAENVELHQRLTALHNDISVRFNTKVIAVASINDDLLATAFAKGVAEDYAINGESSLLIDANMYEPCLGGLLNLPLSKPEEANPVQVSEKISAICLEKETYPSQILKGGLIQSLLKKHKESVDHIIIVAPSLKTHKDIALLRNALEATILVTQQDVTVKKDIFNALRFFEESELPLAKTVLLK